MNISGSAPVSAILKESPTKSSTGMFINRGLSGQFFEQGFRQMQWCFCRRSEFGHSLRPLDRDLPLPSLYQYREYYGLHFHHRFQSSLQCDLWKCGLLSVQIEPTYISIEIRMKCENSKMSEEVPEADRLRLRPYSLDDERALYEVFADPYARTFYPEMADSKNVRAWIEWNIRNYDELGFGLWAVELKVSGEFIGDCGLTYQDVEG